MINQIEESTLTSTERTNQPAPFVATFIIKLHNILSDPKNASIISWTEDGKSFLINSIHQFTQRILPLHFKHKNYTSFIRQLNMYNFTKAKMPTQQKYQNVYFTREDQKLRWIKRRPEKKKKNELRQYRGDKEQQQLQVKQNRVQSYVQSQPKFEKTLQSVLQEISNIPTKKMCCAQASSKEIDNYSKWIQPTSKWLSKKQSTFFCSFKSFTSIRFFEPPEAVQPKQQPQNEQYHQKSITNIMLCNPTANNISQQL